MLDTINVDQMTDENKANLAKLGGHDGLAEKLKVSDNGVNLKTGLSNAEIETSRARFYYIYIYFFPSSK